tara:strand:- start:83 stop:640 length:558 start_codon:yes stop_codon:yes gene_type:complete
MFSIYKIQCDEECYIGHTKNFTKRTYDHKKRALTDKYKHLNLYKKMNETEDVIFEVLENLECDKKTIFRYEQKYIDEYKPSLNMVRAVVDKDILRVRNKLRMRTIVYTEEQKKIMKEKQREYYKKNKDKLLEKEYEYYKNNKDNITIKRKIKAKCDICNVEVLKRCMIQHKKSNKHKKNMLSINI